MYESKSDAKIRGLWADSKQLTVFLSCLLRQPVGFATKCRKGPKNCRLIALFSAFAAQLFVFLLAYS